MEIQQELDKIWGGWKIDKVLGEGAFGKVYRIEKEDFGHIYEAALKVIKIPQNSSELKSIINDGMDEESATIYFRSIVEDLVKEFVLMSKLKGNTNIVSYEDHAIVPHEDEIGWTIFIRMELLTPLYDYLTDHTLTKRDVIRMGIDICKALEVCQKYNIIHRDIKPENMFVSKLGDFELGDFGIARQFEKTNSGMSKKGTYSYMAPEVYKGEEYNSTVDIYSLGIVLYRFLNNNRTPFLPPLPQSIRYSDKERANVMRMSGKEIPKPCNAEGRLAEIVLKACSFQPKDRYESAREMRLALEDVLYEEKESRFIYPEGDELKNDKPEYIMSTGAFSEKKEDRSDINRKTYDNKTQSAFGNVFEEETESGLGKKMESDKKTENLSDSVQKEETEILKSSDFEEITPEASVTVGGFNKIPEEELVQEVPEKNEERQKQEQKKHEKSGSGKKWIAAVAVIALLGVGGIGGYQYYQKSLERSVPNMISMNVDEAKKLAEGDDSSLKVEIMNSEYSDTVPKGAIISQDISEGTVLKKGDTVGVVVSKGALVSVPKVEGKKQEKAEKLLSDAKLVCTVSGEEYSDSVAKGKVISQDVAAGEQLEEGQTVNIVVSKGVEQVEVPDVTGKTLEAAKEELEAAKLKVDTGEDYSDSVEEGKIISQSVDAGKSVDKNTTVKIVVSEGKEPEPTTTSSSSSSKSSSSSSSSSKKSSGTTSKKKSSGKTDNVSNWDLVN